MSPASRDSAGSELPPPPPHVPPTPRPALRLVPSEREDLREFRFEREGAEASFEVASRGGHARTVIGTFESFDVPSQTYRVRGRDGEIVRVALRDITDVHLTSARAAKYQRLPA